jgi:hypothetical protein
MANDTKPTVQGTASDNAGGAVQAQQPAPATSQPQYVTPDQLKAMRDQTLSTVQSMISKSEAGVKTRMSAFEASLANMKSLGQQFTPDQETALRAQAYSKAIAEEQPAAAPGGEPVQGTQQAAAMDPVQLEAQRIQQESGVMLLDGDPEIPDIVYNQGQYAYLKSVEAAVQKKKLRIASNPSEQLRADSAARLPNSGAPAPAAPANSANEYWKRAYDK